MPGGENCFQYGDVDLRECVQSGIALNRSDSTEGWIADTGVSDHITGNMDGVLDPRPLLKASRM